MPTFLALDKVEMLDVAYHETMIPDVAAQAVYTALAYVTQITCAECESRDGEVQRQEMAHGGSVAGMSETDVMVVVAQRHLIIGLSVLWGEHGARQR